MGPLHYFLGLEVKRSEKGIYLSQHKYAKDIVAETGLEGAKHAEAHIPQQHGLFADIGDPLEDVAAYRRLIGRLLYLTLTRPDLSYGVHLLSQYLKDPRKPHMEMAKRVVRYLSKDPTQGIFYPYNNELLLKAYCDADWGTYPTTRRSVTGFVAFLGDVPLTWKSKKQSTVALSYAEAEYMAMAKATKEIIWLESILKDMFSIVPKPVTPTLSITS